MKLIALLARTGSIKTIEEGRRLIAGGGIVVDGRHVLDPNADVDEHTDHVLQIGHRPSRIFEGERFQDRDGQRARGSPRL
jgi:predicted rRNA methylase YqxC with S4 and FtsJ domains